MQGERVQQAELRGGGMLGDRAFALRDAETNKIVSAKQPRTWSEILACSARYTDEATSNAARVVLPGGADFDVDDPKLTEALCALFGRSVTIERVSAADAVYESYWPEMDGLAMSDVTADFPVAMSTEKVSFVDLAALHVVSTSALAHLSGLAPKAQIETRRFRPNIVVDTGEARGFVDNDWVNHELRFGADVVASVGLATMRCIMTTVAQPDLGRDVSVLQTLATHNRQTFEGFGDFACFGAYAEVVAGGTVAVGDEVQLVA